MTGKELQRKVVRDFEKLQENLESLIERMIERYSSTENESKQVKTLLKKTVSTRTINDDSSSSSMTDEEMGPTLAERMFSKNENVQDNAFINPRQRVNVST